MENSYFASGFRNVVLSKINHAIVSHGLMLGFLKECCVCVCVCVCVSLSLSFSLFLILLLSFSESISVLGKTTVILLPQFVFSFQSLCI